jgi:UDP-N-acetylmuramate dehydrogenase
MTLDNYIQTHEMPALRDEPLSRHSTWRIGGPADMMVFPESPGHLRDLIAWVRGQKMPWIVIGKGSNLLFSDGGFRGVVIKLDRGMSEVMIQGRRVTAQSGVSMPRLARLTGRAGLTGLEHTVGVPGSLGGLVAINGGSLRQSIGDVIKTVTVVTPEGDTQTVLREDCDFSYRHSNLLHSGRVIVEVTLELERGHAQAILKHMLSVLRERQAKFPLTLPNCGSVFTSDPALYHTLGPPGKLIEDLGLKGRSRGGVTISHRHANFMVNTGGGTASDVLGLVAEVREAIYARHHVHLRTEVMYVHDYGRIEPVSEVVCPRL